MGDDLRRMRANLLNRSNAAYGLVVLAMIGLGCFRICSTYSFFWQTWDEPFTIAAGMEWLDKGRYTYELFHPPLARVMSALGPYLSGLRSIDSLSMSVSEGRAWFEGSAILQSGGMYEQNLMMARLGILPFFIIASLLVAAWTNVCAGKAASLLATLLFTTLPPILAYSGLATLDMVSATTLTAALFSLTLWLNKPNLLHCVLAGICIGLAILSKLSALGFLLISATVFIILCRTLTPKNTAEMRSNSFSFKQRTRSAMLALLITALTIWAGYRFSLEPLVRQENRPYLAVDKIVGTKGQLHDATYSILEKVVVPAPDFLRGLNDLRGRLKDGHTAFLLGDIRTQGWWYFFPFLFLLKTPLAFILLSGIGYLFACKQGFNRGSTQILFPAVAVLGIFAVGMTSHINNGFRHMLSIYPLLSIVAGFGGYKLISLGRKARPFGLAVATALLAWQLVSSFQAHPNYLTYFNRLAGNHPETIVGGSDLDWGQDLKQLSLALKRRGITDITMNYFGSIGLDLNKFDFPKRKQLKPYQKETGWIAISTQYLQLGTSKPPYDQFAWLKKYQPVEKVGSSIWLYYIPNS